MSEDSYESTLSEHFRIEEYIRLEKEKEKLKLERYEQERKEIINKVYKDNFKKVKLKGFRFIAFQSDVVKFVFTPSEVTKYVVKKTVFVCSIRYRIHKFWFLARNSLPCGIRSKVLNLFTGKTVTDSTLVDTIYKIYNMLLNWCKEQEKFRKEKYQCFLLSKDYYLLDEDDEELFLTEEEQRELYRKRAAIWSRMMVPESKQRIDQRRRRKSSSSSPLSSDTSES